MRINMSVQPDDVTCGPTSLHSIYSYYGDAITLKEVIKSITYAQNGGTLAAYLGQHALQRDYNAELYVFNMDIFDPTWFSPRKLNSHQLIAKLTAQKTAKSSARIQESSAAYIKFLELGGKILYHELTVALLKIFFNRNTPVITGLSATYLYQNSREVDNAGILVADDVNGYPTGHFVVLCGYNKNKRHIVVADPHRENPISHDVFYNVGISRLINSIMLGVLTYDGNLLVITPKERIYEANSNN